ncbi:MAG: GDYXXLXY domain-containing protein [Verrucomicrobia bacterium]|nr:GDYXXLXY domain-containing protein [Verrucomicrobiota bacterium]
MTQPLRVFLFILLAAVQIGVPLSMIMQREHTLRDGTLYKFRTAPVDPYDAFRGRYVALRLDASSVPSSAVAGTYARQQPAYAGLGTDSNGFAEVTALCAERPETGDYLRVRVNYVNANETWITLPFDRFYMDEHDAPRAERAYWQNSTRTNLNTYVAVRVRAGAGVIENLIIDDLPVAEYLNQQDQSP